MAGQMATQAFSPLPHGSLSLRPSRHSDYSPWDDVNVKAEIDKNRFQMDNFRQSAFQGSPQSVSSCMFLSHPVSPPVLHPLSFSDGPQHYIGGSGSKENGYREIPPCRRRLDFNHNDFHHNDFLDISKPVPISVAKRNERERNRVKLINMTFQTLRQHLPMPGRGSKGKSRKLSKVQTLRSAIDYIKRLEDLIEEKKQDRPFHKDSHQNSSSNSKSSLISHSSSKINCSNLDVKLLMESGGGGGGVDEMDRLSVSVQELSDTSFSAYASMYRHRLISSLGEHQSDPYGAKYHMTSSSENSCSTASRLRVREPTSPVSESSSNDVNTGDDDEFLDLDFWF